MTAAMRTARTMLRIATACAEASIRKSLANREPQPVQISPRAADRLYERCAAELRLRGTGRDA